MALGAIIVSMPTAVLGTFYVSIMHGYTTTQGLGAYAMIGSIVLLATMLKFGLSQD